jgi:ParB family chromosome partitioning protein
MEKRSLGRGISALIPPVTKEEARDQTAQLKLEEIKPNPYQPRKDFDNQSLEELTQSIREKGVIQPVLVRRKGNYYELIAGERRFRAANLLHMKEIPVIIKDVTDVESLELSLIENIQREGLNPIEEAHAFQYLIEKFGITQEQIAQVIGKSRASIANILRLLNLPPEIQGEIQRGRISFAHGRLLLELGERNQQRLLAHKIISNGLSVRELENMVKKVKPRRPKAKGATTAPDPYVVAIEEELQHILGTKVRISKNRKRGYIQVEFYSKEELERILKLLRQIKQ